MYTQCPHCNTLFRVHAEQLKAAHGRVRCCRCREAFDALENLGEAPADYAVPDAPDPVPTPEHAPVPPPRRPAAEAAQTHDDLPFEVPENLPDIAAAKGVVDGLSVESRPPSPQRLAWNLGVVALTGLLILQVAWINRESLASYPEGRYLLERFCSLAPCTTPTRKAPDQIRILNREVSAPADAGNARQVRLVIANDAPFPQPYPLLQIELFTGDAKLLAQRRFTPREYLPSDAQSDSLMAPGQTTQLQLDLVDPGHSVTGYRFDFSAL